MDGHREATERAQRLLRGELVEPLPEVPRALVLNGDALGCSWCGSSRLSLLAAVPRPNIAPEDVVVLVRCEECRTRFTLTLAQEGERLVIEVEEEA